MKESYLFICRILLVVCALFANQLTAQIAFPGKVIASSPDPVTLFHASPSIVILPNGTYIASHDWGGANSSGIFTSIYSSSNKGESWELVSVINNLRWANLFYHNNALYIMGVANGMGDICIRRSTDNGTTWTVASGSTTGILVAGRFHTAPTPTVVHNGRIWRAFEESPDSANERDFYAFVLSAPVNSDLLQASNWTRSSKVGFNSTWVNADSPEWCEGNVVVTPEGKIVDYLRMKTDQAVNGTLEMQGYASAIPRYEVAGMIKISDDGKTASFNPSTDFVHFPGASTKFTIRYDPVSKKYWSIVNKITTVVSGWNNGSSNGPWNQRNVIILSSSSDLKNWEERYKLIRWNEGDIITRRETFGFQYVDWQFENNDIVAVMRTSWYGHDWHNANLLTFHRLTDFRNLKMEDSPADIGYLTTSPPALLSWQFSSSAGNENDFNATYNHPNINVSSLVRGAGLSPVVYSHSFSASSSSIHNSFDLAVAQDQYFEFVVQAKEGYMASLSTIDAKLAKNSEGPRSYIWMYNKNDSDFQQIGSGAVFGQVLDDGAVQTTIHLESYRELQNLSATDVVKLRMYVWGASTNMGRISFGRYNSGITTPSLAIGGVIQTKTVTTPILAWDFSSYYSANGSVRSTIKHENLQDVYLTRGTGFVNAGLTGAYNSNTTAERTQSEALNSDACFYFNVQGKEGYKLSLHNLSVRLRRNNTGVTAFRWYYQLNGGALVAIGKANTPFLNKINTGVDQPAINLIGITDLQNLTSSDVVSFRLYGWGALTSTGGFAIGQYVGSNCLAVEGELIKDITSNEFPQKDVVKLIVTEKSVDVYAEKQFEGALNLQVHDLTGRLLVNQMRESQFNMSPLSFPVKLQKGAYIVALSNENSKIFQGKIIQNK